MAVSLDPQADGRREAIERALEALARALGAGREPPAEARAQVRERGEDVGPVGRGRLRGGGRRGRAVIGHEIAQRDVGLVSDRGDHRHGRARHRAGDALGIEGPQVLPRAAAPADDGDVEILDPAEQRERLADRLLGAVALHSRRDDEHLGKGPAAPRDREDVLERSAVRARHDGDALRVQRQRALARRIEQPILRERRPRPLEGELPQAPALGRQQLNHREAQLPLLLPHRGPAEDEDLHAVRRRRRETAVVLLKHHAADLGRAVAEREIPVAALPRLEPADLAPHPERREPDLDHRTSPAGDFGDGPGALRRHRREQV